MSGDQIKGKRVPWSQMEEYVAIHQKSLVSLIDLVKVNVMDIPDVEARLPNSFI